MKRQILLSQLGAALSVLWIGCVPAALGQALPRGGSLIVTQEPAGSFSFDNETPNEVINNFKRTLRLSAPETGVAVVTAHGSLGCTYPLSDPVPAIIDLATQIVRGDEPVDVGDGPGRLHLLAQLPAHGATTFNLASTRAFEVVSVGDFGVRADFHLRLRRGLNSHTIRCTMSNTALTIHYVRTAP